VAESALILGGGGMLARELGPELARRGWEATLAPRAIGDVTNPATLDALLVRLRPAVVLNCAAYTDVERAEDEEATAFAVNADGAGNVARAAAKIGAKLVHLSTDYVFDGAKRAPYVEDDAPNPQGAYARSKRDGEQAVLATGEHACVVRTGELYGEGGRNFFRAILRAARAGRPLRVVDDQIVSPTWTRELAAQLAALVADGALPSGVVHATASGAVSWYDAAVFALRCVELEVPVEPVSTAAYGSRVPRPRYTVLAADVLTRRGQYCMRAWDVALREWLEGPRAQLG
jgi:dTDP-4-dehydrorhamnose reductase